MRVGRILRTLRWLRVEQVVFQLRYRLSKPSFSQVGWTGMLPTGCVLASVSDREETSMGWMIAPESDHDDTPAVDDGDVAVKQLVDWCVKPMCVAGEDMTFLNLTDRFVDWNMTGRGMLWAYNLNYMDWLCQGEMTVDEGTRWIDRFIKGIADNRVGMDPYPTALRLINWAKFFSRFPMAVTRARVDSMYDQACHIERRLERHLLGNHLLEDGYGLFIAGCFLNDLKLTELGRRIVLKQLDEQVLGDGGHYEQSPMYHAILLDRLLDCVNFDRSGDERLRVVAAVMLGYLESICVGDGQLPLLNDSAEGIAPTPKEIFDYARRLGLDWQRVELGESGYRRLQCGAMEAMVDVGGIAASYQPGHSHADALNFELRVDGKPLVVDTGISTYEKNGRRQYERSTAAHNTVTINDEDSVEVWGGFRVGRRCRVKLTDDRRDVVGAELSTGHRRRFEMSDSGLKIEDFIPSGADGVARFYLSPDVAVVSADGREVVTDRAVFSFEGAQSVNVEACEVSRRYNSLMTTSRIAVRFDGRLLSTVSAH